MRKGQRGLVKRTSKRPPTTDGSARARAMADVAPSGSTVSACRNRSASPRATRAPAFIWRARPRGLAMKRTRGEAPHHLGGRVRAAAVDDDDFLPGTASDEVGQEPLEIRRLVERGHDDAQHRRAAQRVQASQRAKSRFTSGVRRVRL